MIAGNIIPFPEMHHSMHCGGCPICGTNDGYLNLGAEHWFICRTHKTRWLAGKNMFDTWKTQTVAQYLVISRLLKRYIKVNPNIAMQVDRHLSFPFD